MAKQKPDTQDLSPIPDDHPIQEHWRNNKLLRSTEGTIQLAKEGDRYAALILLSMCITQLSRQQKILEKQNPKLVKALDPKLMDYMKDCMTEILAGEAAGVALNLRKGKGSGRGKLNAKDVGEKVSIACHVALGMEQGESLNEAAARVAEEFHVSDSTAEKAYAKFMKI